MGNETSTPIAGGNITGNPYGVVVQLFEWRYVDVAAECCDYLGPAKFDAVQVSPVTELRDTSEWWASYQPASYLIGNRRGTAQQFEQMCATCAACGVKVYVDFVANHMAEGSGVGSLGSAYGSRSYGTLFGPDDFHHDVGNTMNNCGIVDYNDASQVQNCDFLGLPTWTTHSPRCARRSGAPVQHLCAGCGRRARRCGEAH